MGLIILAGTANNQEGGKTYTSKDIRIHPDYSRSTADYDVAVIKLSEPMKLDGVTTKPVKLVASGTDTASGSQLLASGWGATVVSILLISSKYLHLLFTNRTADLLF